MGKRVKQNWNTGLLKPDEVEATARLYRQSWIDTFTSPPYDVSTEFAEEKMKRKFSQDEIDRLRDEAKTEFEDQNRAWFVARTQEGEVIGVVAPKHQDDERQQRVGAIYVDQEYRGHGAADELMEAAIDWLDTTKPLYLWVAEQNERAIGFYRRQDFEPVVGEINHFYEKDIPHIKMVRTGDNQ